MLPAQLNFGNINLILSDNNKGDVIDSKWSIITFHWGEIEKWVWDLINANES